MNYRYEVFFMLNLNKYARSMPIARQSTKRKRMDNIFKLINYLFNLRHNAMRNEENAAAPEGECVKFNYTYIWASEQSVQIIYTHIPYQQTMQI